MENQPLHLPISQKIHLWPHLSFRHFNYINPTIHGDSGSNVSSAVKPVPTAVVVRAPVENREASITEELVINAVLTATVAPFERVKLLMQNQNAAIKSGRLLKPYNGMFNCFATTIRKEGLFSLWRGNTAFTIQNLSSKVLILKTLQYTKSHEEDVLSSGDKPAALGLIALYCAGAVAPQLLVYPFFYAGIRMATDVKTTSILRNRQFHGIFDVLRKTLKSDGIAGLYRGFNIFFVQLCMWGAIFNVLEPWEQHYSRHFQNEWSRRTVELGFFIFPLMVCYPLDTLNTRMITSSGGGNVSTLHAIAHIWRNEGVKSFYRGARAEILAVASYKATLLFLIYLAGDIGTSTYNIRWKRD